MSGIAALLAHLTTQSVQRSIEKRQEKKLEEEIDFKSKLFIWSQKNRLPIEFEVLKEENEGASWQYVVRVNINDREYGRGSGSSKKKAEQAAAQETLELLGEL